MYDSDGLHRSEILRLELSLYFVFSNKNNYYVFTVSADYTESGVNILCIDISRLFAEIESTSKSRFSISKFLIFFMKVKIF